MDHLAHNGINLQRQHLLPGSLTVPLGSSLTGILDNQASAEIRQTTAVTLIQIPAAKPHKAERHTKAESGQHYGQKKGAHD